MASCARVCVCVCVSLFGGQAMPGSLSSSLAQTPEHEINYRNKTQMSGHYFILTLMSGYLIQMWRAFY